MESVYHTGELDVQHKTGEFERGAANGRGIMKTIVRGAVNFIEKQPMGIFSSLDGEGNVWTSMPIGDFGFVDVHDESNLSIDTLKIKSDPEDILFNNLKETGNIGSLFIELSTRRRFRINGRAETQDGIINITVDEAYANCPQYIQQRVLSQPDLFSEVKTEKAHGHNLSSDQMTWIHQSDTLFVGSIGPHGRLDASHRGGNSGFIDLIENDILRIPDYYGNSMYNTLGNFSADPRAGLLFVDFDQKKTLQLTGHVELLFDQNSKEDLAKSAGTGRFWTFQVEAWIETKNHHDVNWNFMSYSPFNPVL